MFKACVSRFSASGTGGNAVRGIFAGNMSTSTPKPPAEPELPRPSLLYRCRHLWPIFVAANVGIGGYLLLSPQRNSVESVDASEVEEKASKVEEAPKEVQALISAVETISQVIPEEEKRQLFQWILEEKRKIKPADKAEKKRIDEEKALLKQFIKSKEIPTF